MLVEGASGNQVRAGMPRLFCRMAEALDLGTFAKTRECGRLRRDPDDRGPKDGKTGDEAFEQTVQHVRSLFWCMRVNRTEHRGGGNGVRIRCSVVARFTAWKDDAPRICILFLSWRTVLPQKSKMRPKLLGLEHETYNKLAAKRTIEAKPLADRRALEPSSNWTIAPEKPFTAQPPTT